MTAGNSEAGRTLIQLQVMQEAAQKVAAMFRLEEQRLIDAWRPDVDPLTHQAPGWVALAFEQFAELVGGVSS